jgi:hypothetical protein
MLRTFVAALLAIVALSLGAMGVVLVITGAPVVARPVAATARGSIGGVGPAVPDPPPRAPPVTPSAAPSAPSEPPRPADARPDARPTRVVARAPRAPGELTVSFAMDPRISRSLHMGTRWVSPPTYAGTHRGVLFTVQARAHGTHSRRTFPEATWLASEPDMVAFAPDRGGEVEIVVLREGRSTITVSQGGMRRTLAVSAAQHDGLWRVDLSR